MPFTILFVLFSLVVTAALFALIYRRRGIRAALIASVIVFVALLAAFVLALNVILGGM